MLCVARLLYLHKKELRLVWIVAILGRTWGKVLMQAGVQC